MQETELRAVTYLARVRWKLPAPLIELRKTLVPREIEEFSYKKVAQATETLTGTVESQPWRARQALTN